MPTRVEGALEDLNDAFHTGYDDLRARAELTAPVMIVLADALFVYRTPAKVERPFTARPFHAIKAAAHTPVAVFLALHDSVGGSVDASARRTLTAIRDRAQASVGEVPEATAEAQATVQQTLRATIAFAEHTLETGRLSRAALDAFAAQMGPLVLELTEHATRAQLAALHAAVDEALEGFSADERRTLQVVVAGDHQARVRSLGMQYFQKRLGEEPGEETRVTYAEAIDDPEEALALVGKKRLDRAIASAFFGDAKRLQRDVLGDAAAALLHSTELTPIDR